jgi:hypothetical protein
MKPQSMDADRVRALICAMAKALLAREALLAQSNGHIKVESYPKGSSWDFKVTVESR